MNGACVFYDDETKSCAVIDFDDGMYHWFAVDIEQCFDSIGEEKLYNRRDTGDVHQLSHATYKIRDN